MEDIGSTPTPTGEDHRNDMIIDFHTHLFPRSVRTRRQAYFPGEPAFRLLYESPKARLVGAAEIVSAMDENGVDRSVVFGFPWSDPDTCRENNDTVMEAVSRYPARLIGLGCLDPFSGNAAQEAERCLEGGLAGIGELAFYRSGIDAACLDCLEPIMALCRDRKVPLMIHTNEPVGHLYPGKTPNTLRQIDDLVQRFQNNTLVLAHWGGGLFFYSLLKRGFKERLVNVYFDTAASPFLYDPGIYPLALKLAGPDKVLFGSDYPLIAPARYFNEMKNAGLTARQQADICGNNAARLLGL